jgi:inorganic triphosphatase YgiF
MTGRISREIEGKWTARSMHDFERLLAHAERLGARVSPPRVLEIRDLYLDTPGRYFLMAGTECRLREGEGRWELTVKSVASGRGAIFSRREWTFALDGVDSRASALDLCRRSIFPALVGDRAPYPIVEMRSRRTLREIALPDGSRALSSFDEVQANRNGQSTGICQIEVEFMEGQAGSFERFLRDLGDAIPLAASDASKFALALREFHFRDQRPEPPAYRIVKSDSESVVARKIVCRNARLLQIREPGARIGLDPEAVEEMRVVARRLRTAIRLFKKRLPPEARGIGRSLRWLVRELRRVRDLQTQTDLLGAYETRLEGAEADAIRELRTETERRLAASREDLLDDLGAPRYAALLASLAELCAREDPPPAPDEPHALKAARRVIRKTLGNLARHDRRLHEATPPEALRRFRRSLERLRDTCGFFLRILPPDVKPFLERTDRLGGIAAQLGDLAQTLASLRDEAARAEARNGDGANRGRILRLVADRLEEDRRELQGEFLDAWKKYRKRKNLRLADPTR